MSETVRNNGDMVATEGTFVLMTGPNSANITLPRSLLDKPKFSKLPSIIFATKPPLSEDFQQGKLETENLGRSSSKDRRTTRDRMLQRILEMTDAASGVAAGDYQLSTNLRKALNMSLNERDTALRGLVNYGCITPAKPAIRSRASALIVHPGAIAETVREGRLSLPEPEQVDKLVAISRISRFASVYAVAEALKIQNPD